jgi:Phage portal protein
MELSEYLATAPDFDVTGVDFRRLNKSLQQEARRKRTVSNNFATISGRATPRQGYLPVELLRLIYVRSELVRACIDTLIELVSACEWVIRPINADKKLKQKNPQKHADQQKRIEWATEFFTRPSNHEDLESFHRKLLRDLLIYDAGAYEIVTARYDNGARLPIELGLVPGDTVEIECDRQGIPEQYWQSYNVLQNVEFEEDELAYLMLNPVSWQPYGLSPIETWLTSISCDLNSGKYNSKFFEGDGIPPGLLAIMGVSKEEYTRAVGQMRKTSADNPWNIHTFRASRSADGTAQKPFEYIPLGQTNNDMQFAELMRLCVTRVCMAYKVSPSSIGFTDEVAGGIGSGAADTQSDLMQDKGVAPILRKLSRTHTFNVLHKICGWTDLEFAFVQTNTPQEKQSFDRSLQELGQGVRSINEHRSEFGGRSSVDWGELPTVQLPYWQAPATPQQLQQQAMQMQMGAPPGQPPGHPPNNQPPGQNPIAPPSPPSPLQKSITIKF